MNKIFNPVQTGYDPKNRPVHICKDGDDLFFVYKPRTGYKSRGFAAADETALLAIYERQLHCGHNAAGYLPGEAPGSELADVAASSEIPSAAAEVVTEPVVVAPVVTEPAVAVKKAPAAKKKAVVKKAAKKKTVSKK